MRIINKTAEVPYSAKQMYDLVNGIETYSDYLPWCRSTTVHSRTAHQVKATIHLAKGAVQHSFSTLNTMQPNQQIQVSLIEGPFKHLKGLWQFEDLKGGGCRVKFHLEFVLSNRFLDIAVGSVLEGVANTFVDAFCQRAEVIYGKKPK